DALFRPLPGEVRNPFGAMASLEVLLFIVLALRAFARITASEMKDPIVQWAVLLLCVWGAAYGLFGSGNYGALDRFRLQIMAVMILLFLYVGRAPRFAKRSVSA